MLNPIQPVIDHIVKAFYPDPIKFQLNGKLFLVDRIGTGWTWRNEDGDCQEDFGIIEPFPSAAEAQQSAINHVELGAA